MSEVPDQPTDARERLLSHFKGDEAEYGSKWDELWKEGFLPWDKGFPSPALVDLLAERQDLFEEAPKGRRRKALVPGCGKGYDVLLLSAHGYDAYGLEISGKALDAAKQNEKDTLGDDIYKAKKGVEKGTVTWLEGDFFNDDFLKNVERGGVFDLIYDYTVSLPRGITSQLLTDEVLVRFATLLETCMVSEASTAPCSRGKTGMPRVSDV